MIFFKICPKLMIFQILAKIDDFLKFWPMMIFQNLPKIDDFSNLGKNDDFWKNVLHYVRFSQFYWHFAILNRKMGCYNHATSDGIMKECQCRECSQHCNTSVLSVSVLSVGNTVATLDPLPRATQQTPTSFDGTSNFMCYLG